MACAISALGWLLFNCSTERLNVSVTCWMSPDPCENEPESHSQGLLQQKTTQHNTFCCQYWWRLKMKLAHFSQQVLGRRKAHSRETWDQCFGAMPFPLLAVGILFSHLLWLWCDSASIIQEGEVTVCDLKGQAGTTAAWRCLLKRLGSFRRDWVWFFRGIWRAHGGCSQWRWVPCCKGRMCPDLSFLGVSDEAASQITRLGRLRVFGACIFCFLWNVMAKAKFRPGVSFEPCPKGKIYAEYSLSIIIKCFPLH